MTTLRLVELKFVWSSIEREIYIFPIAFRMPFLMIFIADHTKENLPSPIIVIYFSGESRISIIRARSYVSSRISF